MEGDWREERGGKGRRREKRGGREGEGETRREETRRREKGGRREEGEERGGGRRVGVVSSPILCLTQCTHTLSLGKCNSARNL